MSALPGASAAAGSGGSPLKPSARPAASSGDAAAVSRRLQQELASVMMSGDDTVSAFPQGDSLFLWTGTIAGPPGTPYEGLTYRLSLDFGVQYPFAAPGVKFETPVFHPNVDTAGTICLDILKDKWSAAYSVLTILKSIQSLLGDPNNDSPLNTQAAAAWDGDKDAYRAAVLKAHQGAAK